MTYIILPFVGFFIGLLIIALGGGGGGFYVGILTAFFNIPPAIAAATSLATIIPTTAIGAVSHWKAGNVNLRLGAIMLAGAVIGSIVGSLFSDYVPEKLYNKITGALLLILAFEMLLAWLKKSKNNNLTESKKQNLPDIIKALIYGFIGGAMSGLVGLSGTTPIVAGLAVLGCNALKIVGTSVFVLVGISVTGFLMHLSLGNVEWKLVGLLVLGTTFGAALAPVLLSKIDKNQFEKVFLPFTIVMVFVMGCIVFVK